MRVILRRLVFALALAWAVPASAQVAFESSNFTTNGGCSGTSGPTVSITPSGTDRLLLIWESHFDSSSDATTTMLVGGSSTGVVSRASFDLDSDGRHRGSYFYMIAPAASSLNVQPTFSNSVDGDCAVGVLAFSGVHQSTPLGTLSTTESAASTTCTNSPSGGDTNGMVVQSFFGRGSTATWNQTNRWEAEGIGGSIGVSGMQTASGASATMTATQGSAGCVCYGDVIREVAAAGTTPHRLLLLGVGETP